MSNNMNFYDVGELTIEQLFDIPATTAVGDTYTSGEVAVIVLQAIVRAKENSEDRDVAVDFINLAMQCRFELLDDPLTYEEALEVISRTHAGDFPSGEVPKSINALKFITKGKNVLGKVTDNMGMLEAMLTCVFSPDDVPDLPPRFKWFLGDIQEPVEVEVIDPVEVPEPAIGQSPPSGSLLNQLIASVANDAEQLRIMTDERNVAVTMASVLRKERDEIKSQLDIQTAELEQKLQGWIAGNAVYDDKIASLELLLKEETAKNLQLTQEKSAVASSLEEQQKLMQDLLKSQDSAAKPSTPEAKAAPVVEKTFNERLSAVVVPPPTARRRGGRALWKRKTSSVGKTTTVTTPAPKRVRVAPKKVVAAPPTAKKVVKVASAPPAKKLSGIERLRMLRSKKN